jgi:hypothetical protein
MPPGCGMELEPELEPETGDARMLLSHPVKWLSDC